MAASAISREALQGVLGRFSRHVGSPRHLARPDCLCSGLDGAPSKGSVDVVLGVG